MTTTAHRTPAQSSCCTVLHSWDTMINEMATASSRCEGMVIPLPGAGDSANPQGQHWCLKD